MQLNPGMTFWTIVTFLVVLLVLRLTAWKPILSMIEERERTIGQALESAQKEREEAERLLAEQKEAIANARREAAELIRKNQAEVEAAREVAIERAKGEAEKLLADAQRTISEERAKAVAEIRTLAVDLAIQAAGKLIEENLDEAKQRKLAEDFLQKLPQA